MTRVHAAPAPLTVAACRCTTVEGDCPSLVCQAPLPRLSCVTGLAAWGVAYVQYKDPLLLHPHTYMNVCTHAAPLNLPTPSADTDHHEHNATVRDPSVPRRRQQRRDECSRGRHITLRCASPPAPPPPSSLPTALPLTPRRRLGFRRC